MYKYKHFIVYFMFVNILKSRFQLLIELYTATIRLFYFFKLTQICLTRWCFRNHRNQIDCNIVHNGFDKNSINSHWYYIKRTTIPIIADTFHILDRGVVHISTFLYYACRHVGILYIMAIKLTCGISLLI